MLAKHKQQALEYALEKWKNGESTYEQFDEVFKLVNSRA